MMIQVQVNEIPTENRIFIGEPLASGETHAKERVVIRAAGTAVVILIGSQPERTLRAYKLNLHEVLDRVLRLENDEEDLS